MSTAVARRKAKSAPVESDRAYLRRTFTDPALFAEKHLRHAVWWKQQEILRSLVTHKRVAVKACHASSKTFTAAEAVLWWVLRYRDGVVITTAPTWTQVEQVLWGRIREATHNSTIAWPKIGRTQLRLSKSEFSGEENFALGISTNQGVRFQGWHGRILIIIDEAVGVRPDIYEAIEGIRAGGDVRILMLGNPTVPGGYFYDAFGANRQFWATHTIDALDTPNTVDLGKTVEERLERILKAGKEGDVDFLDTNPWPFLVTRSWIWEKWNEWGPKNPLWMARVRGQFPDQAENAVYAMSWLERAKLSLRDRGKPQIPRTVPYSAGIDVAGPGEDETVLTIRQGGRIVKIIGFSGDARGQCAMHLAPYKTVLDLVNVDVLGIGYYFCQHLKDLGFPVQEVNVTSTDVSDPARFPNLKSEMAWNLRELLEEDQVWGLNDEKTLSQLVPITWGPDARGRIVIESKDDLAERGIKSPDRAESVMMAFLPRQRRGPFVRAFSPIPGLKRKRNGAGNGNGARRK